MQATFLGFMWFWKNSLVFIGKVWFKTHPDIMWHVTVITALWHEYVHYAVATSAFSQKKASSVVFACGSKSNPSTIVVVLHSHIFDIILIIVFIKFFLPFPSFKTLRHNQHDKKKPTTTKKNKKKNPSKKPQNPKNTKKTNNNKKMKSKF